MSKSNSRMLMATTFGANLNTSFTMLSKIQLCFIFFLAISWTSTGQQALEDYLRIGLDNNLELIKNGIRTSRAQTNAEEMRRQYYPNLSFQSTYTAAAGGRNINVPAGDLVNPAYEALNQITNSNQYPTNIANVNEQFLPNNFHDTRLVLSQPLLNSDLYYGYKIRQAEVSITEAKTAAYKNQLRYEIKRGYYNYLKVVRQREILDSTRLILQDLIRVNRKLVKNDVATKDVIYRSESELNQLDAQIAQVDQGIATLRSQFNFLLNRNLNEEILIDEPAPTINPNIVIQELAQLKNEAVQQRSELTQINRAKEVTSLVKTQQEKYWMPEVGLSANFGFQGFGFDVTDNQAYALLGINLSLPIYEGKTNKIKIQQSQLDLELLARDYEQVSQQIQLEVTQAYYVVAQTKKVLEAAKYEVKNSSESHKIIAGKYRQDQALLIELDEARNNMTTAKLNQVIAQYDLKIAEADLLRTLNQ